ncbi:SEC10/PgrA surface exclusion domain-containing protein [Ligilactobacillus salivarius]|uniref:Cell surface protein n=1 Tax=Ligilactobacillus salivarius TaxID=1624 RepID=A0A1D7TU74_9LACO|nr:SEC10/PgrA surface exclusion domain-containing protein [Ligilactobacillus salivarius]AOO74522.1 cell surface protein [Ligilactobacillus salivarius]UDE98123.1 SEC10/PgrA surface exclusion domain-containing protein [Ligilactobacillus salivarius]UUV97253.1 SEC10/PgrA surface exclusion domain-containing protein [Ligilactobacillus salivarius]
MKKKVLTTTIATGLMAAGVLTTQNPASAKADTVPTGDNATSTNEVATQKSDAKTIAQDNVSTAQTNLDKAKADTQNASDSLQQAKVNETTAQKAVDEQTGKVSDAQNNVDKAQADVTTAQNGLTAAQENAKNATETNIQAAKDNVATQEQNVATAQDQAKQANDAVTEQANKVADAQSNVDKAQADVTTAQNNVNAAQKTVDDAKAAMDPANVQATVDAANKAEAQVNQDKQNVATAQTNLENAKTADATRQTNIDNAQKAVNTAQANVDFSTKQAQEMKDQLNKYQGIKDAAQKEVDGLNDKLANVNTITISDVEAYKKAFNDWYTGSKRGENWTEEDKNFLNDFMNSNTYKGNAADKNITVDINHLTADQIKELSLFSADLLNQVRNQLGLPKVIVTEGSLKLAKDVTDNYVSDNWDKFNHDVDGISRAAEENGLLSGGNFYEDAIFSSDFSEASTMDDLKSILYTGIVTMIGGSGDEMLHAAGLLGVDFGDDISTGKEQYFSAGTSMFPIKEDQMWITKMGHFFNVSKDYIRDSAKFSTTEVPGTSTEDLVTQLNTTKAKLASATDALNKAKDADTQAQQILAKNKAELTTAQDNLTKAQNVPVQTATAQKVLTDAQNKLATDTKINEDAQAKKEAALGDEAAKQKVLDQANANLATAQKALTDAQAKQKVAENNLSAEKAKLASLQQVANEKIQDVKTAQVALDDAKNKLAALENAPLLVKAAEDKLVAAQKALDPVENVLVSEKAKLSALKQDLVDAQADVTTAQKNYDEKLAIQTKAQTDLDNAKKVLQAIYDREALETQIAAQEKAREEAEKKAAEEKAQAEKNGYHVDGNKVVDENGNQVSNWTVKNGQIIDNKGKVVSGLTINKAGAVVNKTGQQINSKNVVDNLQANKRTQAPVVQSKVAGKTYVSTVVAPEKAKANALPQTGEKESKTTLVGAILVGLGSLVGLFGLGRKKEY